MPTSRLLARARRALRGPLPTWYDPAYRLPAPTLEPAMGMDPRRTDFAVTALVDLGALAPEDLRQPARASWAELARVHRPAMLEALSDPAELGRVMGVAPQALPVEEVLHTVRLAVGGTLCAAREALRLGQATLNLLGGFHHASPTRAAGLCPVNDIAVAVATLRAEGFTGEVLVIDVDAHPPDGLAACLREDGRVRIGSLSGSDWGPLAGVDETVLPPGTGDGPYLEALDALLSRQAPGDLNFVIAGGDVLQGDRLGQLALSLAGAQERDLRIHRHLRGHAAVWLPGGGYSADAWRLLAGTGLVLAGGTARPVPAGYEPLRAQFERTFRRLRGEQLGEHEGLLTGAELEEVLGLRPPGEHRLLGYYTPSGLEYALYQYGLMDQIRRLGYHDLRVEVDQTTSGDRARLFGTYPGGEGTLVEMVLDRARVGGEELLFVNWLTLRHPLAAFSAERPRLPGQEVPGLGLAPEFGELLGLIARRLKLKGVMFRPAHYHVAIASRHHFRFLDPQVQGRFEALQRDLAQLPLLEATRAIDEGRVWLDGAPWAWEARDMVYRPEGAPPEDPAVAAERGRARFVVQPAAAPRG